MRKESTPKRSRMQFGIRSLLLLFVAVALILVGVVLPYQRKRAQERAVNRIGCEATWTDGAVTRIEFSVPRQPGPGAKLDQLLTETKQLPSLLAVSLEYAFVTDKGLEALAKHSRIHELTLGGHFYFSPSLDLQDYYPNGDYFNRGSLKSPTVIQAIKNDAWNHVTLLRNCEITDDGMHHIVAMKSLKRLSLHNAAISNTGLEVLSSHPGLEELDLRLTLVDDSGMQFLPQFAALKKLDLGNNRRITSAGTTQLKKMDRLEYLRVPYQLDDAGLKELESLTGLKQIDIADCGNLTERAITEFSNAIPDCKIIR